MEISTLVGFAALLVAMYGIYRAMTWNSATFLAPHNETHDEVMTMISECERFAGGILRDMEGLGYIMTESGQRMPQSDKRAVIGLLRQADQAIDAELRIDWVNAWRFRLRDLVQVAAHHKQWREGHLRIKSQLSALQPQVNPIYVLR